MRGSIVFYEDKGNYCSIRSDIAKAGLSPFGAFKKCTNDNDTMLCFNNEVVFTLAKSSVRVLAVLTMDRSAIQAKAILLHNNGRSCYEIEYVIEKIKS